MIERLTALGFTTQEARVYVALLQRPYSTGYELAKATGLQRANVYQVLATLDERDVVDRATADSPAKFVAHPAAEVLGRIKRQTAETADALIAELTALGRPQERAAYTLKDRDEVVDQTVTLVAEAAHRVAVCVWASDLEWLAAPLRMASRAGRQVVVNVFGESDELDFGEVYRHEPLARTVGGHFLTLAVDYKTALVASFDEPAGAVFTSHPALVRVVEKLIRDETYMAEIYHRFGPQLEAEFGPHLVDLRTRLLPPDQAEALLSIVGFGATTTNATALLEDK
ncbi:hypothetical protein Afil01_18650 [Actinorhabdospora filicis]|uniref:TrmB family transcriptional regulator n=1 Tax=Actinorhabdospora filicis TaxID=1785913 RepID=A0A9W6SIU1_9ACTN|nr:helix-turn-helix domain-containing protein [Actinorhabdospora filicis]GLZ77058.1 hypothetical protein Afil01_18650 [Actinorhabdospora filicis]